MSFPRPVRRSLGEVGSRESRKKFMNQKNQLSNVLNNWFDVAGDIDFSITLLQNIPEISSFIDQNPWAIPSMLVILPMLLVWRKLALDKLHPLLSQFENLPESSQKIIAKSERFHKAFAQVFEALVKECDSEKGKIYENFIGNLMLNAEDEEDTTYYSKLILVLLNIQPDEYEVFLSFFGDLQERYPLLGRREDYIDDSVINERVWGMHVLDLDRLFDKYDKESLTEILNSLHSFRLIRITDTTYDGVTKVQGKTKFSDLFYKYLK